VRLARSLCASHRSAIRIQATHRGRVARDRARLERCARNIQKSARSFLARSALRAMTLARDIAHIESELAWQQDAAVVDDGLAEANVEAEMFGAESDDAGDGGGAGGGGGGGGGGSAVWLSERFLLSFPRFDVLIRRLDPFATRASVLEIFNLANDIFEALISVNAAVATSTSQHSTMHMMMGGYPPLAEWDQGYDELKDGRGDPRVHQLAHRAVVMAIMHLRWRRVERHKWSSAERIAGQWRKVSKKKQRQEQRRAAKQQKEKAADAMMNLFHGNGEEGGEEEGEEGDDGGGTDVKEEAEEGKE